jgi:hypothetical protein
VSTRLGAYVRKHKSTAREEGDLEKSERGERDNGNDEDEDGGEDEQQQQRATTMRPRRGIAVDANGGSAATVCGGKGQKGAWTGSRLRRAGCPHPRDDESQTEEMWDAHRSGRKWGMGDGSLALPRDRALLWQSFVRARKSCLIFWPLSMFLTSNKKA